MIHAAVVAVCCYTAINFKSGLAYSFEFVYFYEKYNA